MSGKPRRNGAIELSRSLLEEIVAHARAERPNEACGVVAGRDGTAIRVYPMRNAEASKTIYRFDSQEQLRVLRDIEERGWQELAFFHSHPHTEAFPSPTDVAEAHFPDPSGGDPVPRYPGTVYLIVSLREPDRPVLRGFTFEDGQPVEQDVRIT